MYCSLNAPPLGLNLDLVTGENQAYFQRKGTLVLTQVPLRTNDGRTLSVREASSVPHKKTGTGLGLSTISIAGKILGRVVKGGNMRCLL